MVKVLNIIDNNGDAPHALVVVYGSALVVVVVYILEDNVLEDNDDSPRQTA